MFPANVDTPDTLILSNSVWPSTSRLPLASMFPANVETPVTAKLPASSISALASISSANVAIPAILTSSKFV